MEELYVIGAGSAGKDILHTIKELNKQERQYTILGYIDEDVQKHHQTYEGIEIKGGLDYLLEMKQKQNAICTIGNCRNKKRIIEKLGDSVNWVNIFHPNISYSEDLTIGVGNYIYSFVTISRNVKIGSHCSINSHVLIGHDVSIGNYCSIQPGVKLVESVKIDETCYIGLGSILYGGIKVGKGSKIGAGSIVGFDVPEKVLVMGTPARVIQKLRE